MAFGNPTATPGDYYAPFYTVRFMVPSSDQYLDDQGNVVPANQAAPITTLTSDVDPARNTRRAVYIENNEAVTFRSYISSIIIEGVSSSAYRATVTMTPPYDVAVQLLNDKVIKFGSVMEIQWGYRGSGGEPIESPIHLFRIVQPSCQFGQTTTITIIGRDIHSVTAETRRNARSWPRSRYSTDISILQTILSELQNGYKLDTRAVSPDSKIFKPGEGEGYEQKETYARFFTRVCNKHNLGWIIKDKTLVLFNEEDVAKQTPSYRLLWRTPPWKQSPIPEIPVKEVTINPIATLFQGMPAARGVLVDQPDLDKNNTPQTRSDDSTNPYRTAISRSIRTVVSAVEAAPAAFVQSTVGPVAADPAMPQNAVGEHQAASSREPYKLESMRAYNTRISRLTNTTATVQIPGHPAIHPQMIVDVVGLPKIFAGRYLIRSAKHVLGASYTCELELYARTPNQDPTVADGAVALGNVSQGSATTPDGDQAPTRTDDGKPV